MTYSPKLFYHVKVNPMQPGSARRWRSLGVWLPSDKKGTHVVGTLVPNGAVRDAQN